MVDAMTNTKGDAVPPPMAQRDQRDTIFVEAANVLAHETRAGGQFIMRLNAPQTAAHARPGAFVHLQCAPTLLMRRPMSIMRTAPKAGWIEILYKKHGKGTQLLARRQIGEVLSVIGPIGVPFKLEGYRGRPLLIGGGVGIPPMIFFAEHLKNAANACQPLVLMGSEIPFPFKPRPSRILVPSVPNGVIAAMPLLEDWGIPSRLASLAGYPGCFEGYVTDLARATLHALDDTDRHEVEVFACGPDPMLRAVAALARSLQLPCQVCVEEYMACAVGGCAGCVVHVLTDQGPTMKRVCVDGPVFDAKRIYPV